MATRAGRKLRTPNLRRPFALRFLDFGFDRYLPAVSRDSRHIGRLAVMAFGLATFSVGSTVAEDLKVGDWLVYVDFDHGSDTTHKEASTSELSGRAAPLLLQGCSESVDISEQNSRAFKPELSYLFFNFLPDDSFEAERGRLDSSGTTLWWLRFANDGTSAGGNYPLLFEAGMDGYYFSLDRLYSDLLLDNTSFLICKSNGANAQLCREFSLKGLADAVRFVCRREIER